MQFAKDTLGGLRTVDMRLEEVESETVAGKDVWRITLSMISNEGPASAMSAFASAFVPNAKREYKVFTVAKESGEVISMKIREFATR